MIRGKTTMSLCAAGGVGVLLAVSGCGNDVPGGPMDEDELETVYPTGRAVPEGWDLSESPSGRDRYGDDLDDFAITGSSENEECADAQEELEGDLSDLSMVAESTASYSQDTSAFIFVSAFSTDEESDIMDSMTPVLEECSDLILAEASSGWDGDDFDVDSTGASISGVSMVNDSAEGGSVIMGGQSYGQNHLVIMGASEDARDLESLEEAVDAIVERFEEGPDDEGNDD